VDPAAPQIDVTVLQPQIFGSLFFWKNLKGERLTLTDYLALGDDYFDLTGSELGVDRLHGPQDHLARDPDNCFLGKLLHFLVFPRAGVTYQLGFAVMIAKIDEQDPAMVPLVVDPSR
jgi:hypothetical protein